MKACEEKMNAVDGSICDVLQAPECVETRSQLRNSIEDNLVAVWSSEVTPAKQDIRVFEETLWKKCFYDPLNKAKKMAKVSNH